MFPRLIYNSMLQGKSIKSFLRVSGVSGWFLPESESGQVSNSITQEERQHSSSASGAAGLSYLLLGLEDVAAEDVALSISGDVAEDLQVLGVVGDVEYPEIENKIGQTLGEETD